MGLQQKYSKNYKFSYFLFSYFFFLFVKTINLFLKYLKIKEDLVSLHTPNYSNTGGLRKLPITLRAQQIRRASRVQQNKNLKTKSCLNNDNILL